MAQSNLRVVEANLVDKSKALDAALSQIERSYGKGSIMRLGANQPVAEISTISTGSPPPPPPSPPTSSARSSTPIPSPT